MAKVEADQGPEGKGYVFVFWYFQNTSLVTKQFSCFQNNTWQNFIDFTYLKILVESLSGDKEEKDYLDPGILGAISD